MTIAVDLGRKAPKQTKQNKQMLSLKCLEKSSLSCWKKSAPVPKKKTEWYVSKPTSLLYQVQQQHFKDGLIL